MPVKSNFTSVKLSAALVEDARASADTMRRSVASQIEYWAALGRALESAGLTAKDTGTLIARQDAAAYAIRNRPRNDAGELDALKSHVVALAKSGALTERARLEVAANAAKAPRGKAVVRARKAV